MTLATMINHNALSWQHIVFALLFTIACCITTNLPYWKRKGKEKICQAVIKTKRMEYSNTPQIYYRGNRWNYLVTFEYENGTTVELHTTEQIYGKLTKGMTGMLTYQGENLIEFETI